jgi:DNA-binding NarL/FixJ family response regulator
VAGISHKGGLGLAFAQHGGKAAVVLSSLQLLAFWLAGVLVRARRQSASLARRNAALQRQAEQATAAERARIARELHDIVAHHLSVIVLQAAAAQRPGRAAGPALKKIEHSGRQALTETRRMLGVLRDPGEETGLAPQPGISELDTLAGTVRAAGLPVNLVISGDPAAVPAAADVSVYRIVQEALTNILKHAGPRPRGCDDRLRGRSGHDRDHRRRNRANPSPGPGRRARAGRNARAGRDLRRAVPRRAPARRRVHRARPAAARGRAVISVLIADDQDLIREGLRVLLEDEPDLAVAGEACDGSQALTQARLLDPDVILMDVRMPHMNGIEATTRLVQAGSRARILMLTTFNLDEYVYHALKAGASGFLLKDATREQLTGAVRAVAAGETLLAPAITRRLIEDFCRDPAPGTAPATATGRLSERELGVVRLVAQGLSNAEIAARLYLSETTVKSHIARILAKLDLRDRVQVAVYAYEHGIVRPGHRTPPPGRGTRP